LLNSDLTTKNVNGSGTFDVLMASVSNHLKEEYEKGRISGGEYTKAYIALAEAAMANSVQFLISRDQAYWEAQTAQINAITALITTEVAKAQLLATQFDAFDKRATYALTKIRLSEQDVNYCIAQFNLENILPAQEK